MRKVTIVTAIDVMNVAAQTSLFHRNTFNPSMIANGMRLKRAIQALKAALNHATVTKNGPIGYSVKTRDASERMRFVSGPARAVFPAVFLLMGPAMSTAPGEISLIGENMERSVMRAPNMVSRNSAQRP